jgi:hypothetical protein
MASAFPGKLTERRTLIAAAAAAILLSFLIILLLIEPATAAVSFVEYERSGSSNYAVLTITNLSQLTFHFTSQNTFPEGTVRHFVSVRQGSGWTEPVENKPHLNGNGTLYRFVEELSPKVAQKIRVPVDQFPRKVGVPVYSSNIEISRLRQLRLLLRNRIRKALNLPDQPGTVIWCPTELRVEIPTDNR